jgi:hypothetical protein
MKILLVEDHPIFRFRCSPPDPAALAGCGLRRGRQPGRSAGRGAQRNLERCGGGPQPAGCRRRRSGVATAACRRRPAPAGAEPQCRGGVRAARSAAGRRGLPDQGPRHRRAGHRAAARRRRRALHRRRPRRATGRPRHGRKGAASARGAVQPGIPRHAAAGGRPARGRHRRGDESFHRRRSAPIARGCWKSSASPATPNWRATAWAHGISDA